MNGFQWWLDMWAHSIGHRKSSQVSYQGALYHDHTDCVTGALAQRNRVASWVLLKLDVLE